MIHILAADIGGTNCRLGLFSYDGSKISMDKLYTLPTASLKNTADLAKAYEDFILNNNVLDKKNPTILSIAFAGNISGKGETKLTNAELSFDIVKLKGLLDMQHELLLNDFVAQAYAFCVYDIFNAVEVILENNAQKNTQQFFTNAINAKDNIHSLRAIVGAGTGLGIASLLSFAKDNYLAMPSESGHSAFPFVSPFEYELSEFIKEKLNVPYASYEHILSGGGLSLVYEFLTGKIHTAQEICTHYLHGDILHYFSTFLGRVCRDLALSTLCTNGLYLTGGVLAKNPVIAQHNSFKKEFYLSPKHSQWLKSIPVYLNVNENSGLWGAAYAATLHHI